MNLLRVLLFPLLLIPIDIYSQGCSDAGFCTMGAMRPDQLYNTESVIKLRSVELNRYYGETTLSPIINVTSLDFVIGINQRNFLQVKVPYQKVEGNLTNAWNNKPITGLGDISLSFTRSLVMKNSYEINVSIGGKIPSNNANLQDERGNDLHMYYQTSLGTYDIVLGGSMISKKWLFATGLQVPLVHINKNGFRHDEWGEYPNPNYITDHNTHPPGTEFKRGSDIMLRAERNFRFSNFSFNVGLLPIFRFAPDRYYDPSTGTTEKIDGTTGLALSALAGASYHFNVNATVKAMYGRKITQRDFNPDGLTRHAVASLAFVYRF